MKYFIQFFTLILMSSITPTYATPFSCANNAYTFESPTSSNYSNIYNIDLSNGNRDYTTTITFGSHINATGYNPKDNYIYGFTYGTKKVIKIDSNFNVTDTGISGTKEYTLGDINREGIYYLATLNVDLELTEITTIDLETHAQSTITLNYPIGVDKITAFDFAFNPIDNELYLISDAINNTNNHLMRIKANGDVEDLGEVIDPALGVTFNSSFAFFDKFGTLYFISPSENYIYIIDIVNPNAGTFTAIEYKDVLWNTGDGDGARCAYADIYPEYDYGDAETGSSTPWHKIDRRIMLGSKIDDDNESMIIRNANADWDDTTGDTPDDEDGISSIPLLYNNMTSYSLWVNTRNQTGKTAYITAWIDWDEDQNFNSTTEAITTAPIPVDSSSNVQSKQLIFNVPTGLLDNSKKILRVRISTNKIETDQVDENRDDGEIEEYIITIKDPLSDYGDSSANSKPRHVINSNLTLGSNIDGEVATAITYDENSSWDDNNGDTPDDEDGITLSIPPIRTIDTSYSLPIKVKNTTGQTAYISAWIDFDGNGIFEDRVRTMMFFTDEKGEAITDYVTVGQTGNTPVTKTLTWDLSNANLVKGVTTLRVRVSTSKVLLHDDVDYNCNHGFFTIFMCGVEEADYLAKPDGEIEEYTIEIKDPQYDYGDAPTTYTATPKHAITPNLTLGATVDAESSAKTSNDAMGDDIDGNDDEDAISVMPTLLTIDSSYSINISVKNNKTEDAYVTAWIDWNNDNSFSTDEVINGEFVTIPALSDITTQTLQWSIPSGVTLTPLIEHLLRIRVSTDKLLTHEADVDRDDGEIEEYLVVVTEPDYDYGDAPTGYGTPRHAINSDIGLGVSIDAESTANSSVDAQGDDNQGSDDEDSITTLNKLYTASHDYTTTISVKNNTSSTAYLTAWIDWNGDNQFNGSDEIMISDSLTIAPLSGTTTRVVNWNVPSAVTLNSGDKKLLRVRISTEKFEAWDFDADRDDGEIEEYLIDVLNDQYDYGDAPTGYDQPKHAITNEIRFGDKVDSETTAYTSANADGDDTNGIDDEDGMSSPTKLLSSDQNYTTTILATNNSNKIGYITAWIDWNNDKTFDGADEAINTAPIDVQPNSGQSTKTLTWSIPSWITLTAGEKKVLRVRISSVKLENWDFNATRDDGEIEEYMIEIENPPYDFGDAPAGYSTPHHTISNNLTLGVDVDSELSAYSSGDAHGDDDHADDEDGIQDHVIPMINKAGSTYSISTTYNNSTGSEAWITAWIDFDGDNDFDDSYDATTTGAIQVPNGSGAVTLNFDYSSIASSLVVGSQKILRVRISSNKLEDTQADENRENGEIEEYPIIVTEPSGVGLLVDYHFDECSWNGTTNEVINSNGVSLHGTSSGDAYTTYKGIVNRAGHFDGDHDSIKIEGSASSLDLQGDASFSMWIKPTDANPAQGLIIKNEVYEYLLFLESGRVNFIHGDGSDVDIVTSPETPLIQSGTWNHIVVTRDSLDHLIKFYLNGIAIASSSYTKVTSSSSDDVYIGDYNGLSFDGEIDEVKIFEGKLDDTNITAIYNNELAGNNWDGTERVATPCYDYGDAPVGYSEPNHKIEEDLHLGDKVDAETGVQHSANADGDNNTGQNDEDSNWSPPPLNVEESVYNIGFNYVNDKSTTAYITGWIDLDNNQSFEVSEANQNGAIAVDPNSAGSKLLTFNIPTGLPDSVTRVLRVRISTTAINKDQADQNRSDGEIEEHLVTLRRPLAIKLVADYHFDECEWTGETEEVKDSSSNNLHGQAIHNADTLHSGEINRAGYFDGDGDYVKINNNSELQLTQDSSFMLWVKPEDLSLGRQGLIFKDYNNEYELILEPTGKISFYHGDGNWENGIDEPSTMKATQGEWTHIAITRDDINRILTFYINGVRVGTDNYYSNITSGSNALKIGSRWDTTNSFRGMIDEVKLFEGTLKDENITEIYNNEVANRNWDGTDRASMACNLVDYGDADVINQPSHGIDTNLTLGDIIDSESSALTSPHTLGDDHDKLDDEDGIISLPTIDINDASYSANVKVTNKSSKSAFVTAWIDFNSNNIFESFEVNDAIIPVSAGQTVTRTLSWSSIPTMIGTTNRTLRVRLSSTALNPDEASLDRDDGEIEDYSISVTNLNISTLRFNVERVDSNSTNIIPDRYNLYTQVAGRDFDYSVLVYDKNETTLLPRSIDRVTAKIELVDRTHEDNVLMTKYVHFGTPATSREDIVDLKDLQLSTATRKAQFRITLPIVNIAGEDRLIEGIANDDEGFNILASGGTNISYSKDYFAIRPASYRLSIKDDSVQIGQDNSHPENSSPHDLAVGYDYTMVGVATQYQLDIKADGYSVGNPSFGGVREINTTLQFKGSTNCADQNDKIIKYTFDDGVLKSESNTTAKLIYPDPNVGEYLLHMQDSSWTGVDFNSNPSQSGCITGSSSIPTDKKERVGCNIISNFTDEDSEYMPKHYDLNVSLHPHDFNLTEIDIRVIPDDKNFLYMNRISDNPDMAVRIFGKLYPTSKGENSSTSNFTDGCSSTEVHLSIKHTLISEYGTGKDSEVQIETGGDNPQAIPFQRRVKINGIIESIKDSNISDVITISSDKFLSANGGEATIELLYNLKKDYNQTINPIMVEFSSVDANISTLNGTQFTPFGSEPLDRNISFYYARVTPDRVNYPITYGHTAPIVVQTPLTVEIFCSTHERTHMDYCQRAMRFNGVKNSRTVQGWYTSINHNGFTDGRVEAIATNSAHATINPNPVGNFINGRVVDINTTYNIVPADDATVEVDANVTTWLIYQTGFNDQNNTSWRNIFENNETGSWSGTGTRGKIIDIKPNRNPTNRISW